MMPSVADVKSIIKTIGELYQKGSQLEAQKKIVELQEMVLEFREAARALREENVALREELSKQNELSDISKRLEWDGSQYWVRSEGENGEKEGPYCPLCWDDKKKLIRLLKIGEDEYAYWECPKCNTKP